MGRVDCRAIRITGGDNNGPLSFSKMERYTIGVITDYFVGKEDLLRIFNKNNKDEKVKKYEL